LAVADDEDEEDDENDEEAGLWGCGVFFSIL
jgi:hypothetical protein